MCTDNLLHIRYFQAFSKSYIDFYHFLAMDINMSFQTTDSKKEEFRKYLEKSGVIDQLTRVLVGLYEEPEKPSNAIE